MHAVNLSWQHANLEQARGEVTIGAKISKRQCSAPLAILCRDICLICIYGLTNKVKVDEYGVPEKRSDVAS